MDSSLRPLNKCRTFAPAVVKTFLIREILDSSLYAHARQALEKTAQDAEGSRDNEIFAYGVDYGKSQETIAVFSRLNCLRVVYLRTNVTRIADELSEKRG